MAGRTTAEAGPIAFEDVAFAAGASVTNVVDLPGKIVSIAAAATGVRGTVFFVQAATTKDGTMARVKSDTNNSVSVTTTTRTVRFHSLEPAKTFGVRYTRIEANSVSSATASTGSATVTIGYIR